MCTKTGIILATCNTTEATPLTCTPNNYLIYDDTFYPVTGTCTACILQTNIAPSNPTYGSSLTCTPNNYLSTANTGIPNDINECSV